MTSEQLKRKFPKRNFEKQISDDEEETFYLISFEEKNNKREFGIVCSTDVKCIPGNLDKGIYKSRGKTYTVTILKRGTYYS